MDNQEKLHPRQTTGMMLSKLDVGTLTDMIGIYTKVVGGQNTQNYYKQPEHYLDYIKKTLDTTNFVGLRWGSKLKDDKTQDAKLAFWEVPKSFEGDKLIRIDFDPNVAKGEDADHLKSEFREAISEYLNTKDLAVTF